MLSPRLKSEGTLPHRAPPIDARGRSINMLRQYLSSACPGTRFFHVFRTNLAGFLTHLFSAIYASSTILSTVSAISYSHKIVGLADPADNFYIKKTFQYVFKKVLGKMYTAMYSRHVHASVPWILKNL